MIIVICFFFNPLAIYIIGVDFLKQIIHIMNVVIFKLLNETLYLLHKI